MWMTSLAVVSLMLGDAETALTEAQARAAVAVVLELQHEHQQDHSPKPASTTPVPWVRAYAPSFPCPVCDQVKADARHSRFPFQLIWGSAPAGFEIDYYPAFHWNDAQGRGCRWPPPGNDNAYPGPAALVEIWKKTQALPRPTHNPGGRRSRGAA